MVFLCVREKGKVNFRMMADEVFMKRSEPELKHCWFPW